MASYVYLHNVIFKSLLYFLINVKLKYLQKTEEENIDQNWNSLLRVPLSIVLYILVHPIVNIEDYILNSLSFFKLYEHISSLYSCNYHFPNKISNDKSFFYTLSFLPSFA